MPKEIDVLCLRCGKHVTLKVGGSSVSASDGSEGTTILELSLSAFGVHTCTGERRG